MKDYDLNLCLGDIFDILISFNLTRNHDMSQISRMKIIIITITTIYLVHTNCARQYVKKFTYMVEFNPQNYLLGRKSLLVPISR